MKALVLYGKHDAKVSDFQEPVLKENAVKVAVSYCGLCGTDIHKFDGKAGSRPVIPPVVLGHEVSGIVVEKGEAVQTLDIGDRVCVDPNWNCNYCYYCNNNMPHMCEHAIGVAKGFAQYVCPPQENVYKIPKTLSLKYASLAEPLSCCLHGMDLLDVKLGETIMIVGMGAIGMMMVQLCKYTSAADIIVVETLEAKRAIASSLGATLFINPLTEDVKQVLKDHKIKNVDKVMECVGLKETIENALEYAGKCATVMLFGLGDQENPAHFNQYQAFQKELTIKNSYVNPRTMQRAINLLASNAIDFDTIVSAQLELEEVVSELKNRIHFKKGKVIVKVSGHEKYEDDLRM